MQTLYSSETLMVSGGGFSHLVGGVVVGGSLAAVGLYFPLVSVIAGCCSGAVVANTYSTEIDTIWNWGRSFFASSEQPAEPVATTEIAAS
ncbi:MAG: hypothetical protein BGO43_15360 [Gammaproteobacteria bacterium 39-13]|nr:hypothetical protein [Gammaproteobacteria bacterium]OJV87793.1 MAG: hypothetical protein BGO43_15360 [Gammaproteobacteria bacterium 39-13]